MSTSSLTDLELYQQQQQKLVELDNQIEKLRQYDYYSFPAIDQLTTTNVKNFVFFILFN